jgi:hypothetical protein
VGARGSELLEALCYKPGWVPDEDFISTGLILTAALSSYGSTMPVAEVITRKLPGGKGPPARKC